MENRSFLSSLIDVCSIDVCTVDVCFVNICIVNVYVIHVCAIDNIKVYYQNHQSSHDSKYAEFESKYKY